MLISSDLLVSKTITLTGKNNFNVINSFFYLLICLLILSCVSSDANKRLIKTDPTNTYWRDLSLFLSGLPLDEKNQFLKLSDSSSYKNYSKTINSYWEKIEKDYLQKVHPFNTEFMPDKFRTNTAFYPLSGADFVNLHAFYPDAISNIMIGLEPPG